MPPPAKKPEKPIHALIAGATAGAVEGFVVCILVPIHNVKLQ